jgi:exodeoxyribonuclease VII large subunit
MRFERVGGRLRVEALANRLDQKRRALEAQSKLLTSYSYQGVLARGFAIVRDENGAMVRRAVGLNPGRSLEIEFSDGRTAVQVASGTPGKAAPPSSTPAPPPRKKGSGPPQGSLF